MEYVELGPVWEGSGNHFAAHCFDPESHSRVLGRIGFLRLRVLKCPPSASHVPTGTKKCRRASFEDPHMPPESARAVGNLAALRNQTSNQTSGRSLVSCPRLPRFASFPFHFPFRGEKGSGPHGCGATRPPGPGHLPRNPRPEKRESKKCACPFRSISYCANVPKRSELCCLCALRKTVHALNFCAPRALSPPDGGGVDVWRNSRQICDFAVKNFKERWVSGEWNMWN